MVLTSHSLLVCLIVLLALVGTSQARLADPDQTPSNEFERSLIFPGGNIAECQGGDDITCIDYFGYVGRIMHKQTILFGIFGIGCWTKCVSNFWQGVLLIFGFQCGICQGTP